MPASVSKSVVIAINATVSGAVDLSLNDHLARLVGFVMPAAFTGASISFQVSADDSTYQALYDDANSLVSITVSASRTYGFRNDVAMALGHWRFVKFVSASAEGAERTIVVYTK